MQNAQQFETSGRLARNLLALAVASLLGAVAVVTGVSNHEEPASRYVVLECQGFDALATAGAKPSTCDPGPARDAADMAEPRPVRDDVVPAASPAKA